MRVRRCATLVAMSEPRRRRTLRLRTRVTLFFSLNALVASLGLAVVTFAVARSFLIDQRQQTAQAQAYANAKTVRDQLLADQAFEILSLRTETGGFPLLIRDGRPFVPNVNYPVEAFPLELRTAVTQGQSAQQRFDYKGKPYVAVGVDMPAADAQYFEAFPMESTEGNLRTIATALLVGSGVTILFAAFLGWWTSRRLLRPLSRVATAAGEIASGGLDARMPSENDPDLDRLASSFNDMADAVQTRLEREARFASDVSHELRSPLMTLAASAEVMQARRDDMPERAQAALDLLVADVTRFQGLVEDLLEISRFDAGAIRLNLDDLLVAEFVRHAVAASSAPATPVAVTERAERVIIRGDRRRLARVMANLIDNARLHGGGDATIAITEPEGEGEPLGHIWITVEDHGLGVPVEERNLVFERFARGAVAGRRSSSDGAGLGLSLVDEHIRMHGGRVWVEDRLDGEPGARFVLELPADEVGV